MRKEATPEKVVQEIRRKTRRRFSAEEKIRIVLEGLRGEESIAMLCRKEGLAPARRRHDPRGDVDGSHRSPQRKSAPEAARRGDDARESPTQKSVTASASGRLGRARADAAGTRVAIHGARGTFFSESSVYRILKPYDLIASPAFVVLSAGKTFQHPTHRPNELWQTDFTYLHVVG
jgi:transposase-like protein